MKYIDADLLRGKISEQMESLPREVGRGAGTITSKGYGMMEALQIVRSIIDSLQQELPGVDLRKEIEKYFKGWTETDEGIACHYQYVDLNTCRGIAYHFYELGLKSREG
jgi:hypothetical protein